MMKRSNEEFDTLNKCEEVIALKTKNDCMNPNFKTTVVRFSTVNYVGLIRVQLMILRMVHWPFICALHTQPTSLAQKRCLRRTGYAVVMADKRGNKIHHLIK